MKICHLTSAHKSNDMRIFQKECVSLAKLPENEVYLIAPGESYIKNNVHIVGIGNLAKSRLIRMTKGVKTVYKKAISLNADIYHLHDPELLQIAIKLKKKGKKVIFDSHEYYYEQIKNKYYIPRLIRNFIGYAYYKFETFVCKSIDAVIFPCTLQGGNPFNGRAKNIVFIQNYPIFYIDSPTLSRDEDLQVCYLGTLSKARGITNLVKACFEADFKLTLAGTFVPPEYKDELVQMKEYKIVQYLGVLPKEEVSKVYAQSHVGAALLLDVGQYWLADNLSTKVYECMMYGLPVILSNTPYAKKIISENEFGCLVNPYNVEDITMALEKLKDANVRNTLGRNGRQLVEKEFNWNTEEQKLFNLYRSL